jgi:hypothetical protein
VTAVRTVWSAQRDVNYPRLVVGEGRMRSEIRVLRSDRREAYGSRNDGPAERLLVVIDTGWQFVMKSFASLS